MHGTRGPRKYCFQKRMFYRLVRAPNASAQSEAYTIHIEGDWSLNETPVATGRNSGVVQQLRRASDSLNRQILELRSARDVALLSVANTKGVGRGRGRGGAVGWGAT